MFYNRNLLNFCEAQGKDIFGLGMHFKAFLEILGCFGNDWGTGSSRLNGKL